MRSPGKSPRHALALVIAVALVAPGCEDASPPAPALETADAHDFTLSDQFGRPFRLSDQRGRLVLLFFGYTHCPDVCPTTLSSWAKVESVLGDQADDVTFAFVTVDPQRDTPERLARHLAVFSPRFLGLSGTREELARVYETFRVVPERVPIRPGAAGYLIDHSTRMFLIDQEGVLKRRFNYRKYPYEIAGELKWFLDEPRGADAPKLSVRQAWSRPTAPGQAAGTVAHDHGAMSEGDLGPGVVYLSIVNEGDGPDRLLSIRSPVCAAAELHRTTMDGDRMRMAPVEGGLDIPAGATIELSPGGYHIMLNRLHHDLLPGQRFELVLVFERAGEVTVESEVRSP